MSDNNGAGFLNHLFPTLRRKANRFRGDSAVREHLGGQVKVLLKERPTVTNMRNRLAE